MKERLGVVENELKATRRELSDLLACLGQETAKVPLSPSLTWRLPGSLLFTPHLEKRQPRGAGSSPASGEGFGSFFKFCAPIGCGAGPCCGRSGSSPAVRGSGRVPSRELPSPSPPPQCLLCVCLPRVCLPCAITLGRLKRGVLTGILAHAFSRLQFLPLSPSVYKQLVASLSLCVPCLRSDAF